jgi:hypothetical protein
MQPFKFERKKPATPEKKFENELDFKSSDKLFSDVAGL